MEHCVYWCFTDIECFGVFFVRKHTQKINTSQINQAECILTAGNKEVIIPTASGKDLMMLIVLWSMLPHPDSLLLVELYVITQIEDYPGGSLERRRCIYVALILLSHRCQHHWHFVFRFPSQATTLHMQPRLTITLLFPLPKPNHEAD